VYRLYVIPWRALHVVFERDKDNEIYNQKCPWFISSLTAGIEVSDTYNLANARASLSSEWVGYSGLKMAIDRRSRIEYAHNG